MSQEKESVREFYSAIAQSGKGCCGPAPCGGAADTAERIGYTAQEISAIPEGANLGLGCGNPLALAGISPGETVLDLGCGGGFDVFLAAARVGPAGRVIGIDMTPEMIERARSSASQAGLKNVEFRLGEIEQLPVEEASIDLVISNCVLNLVPDKEKAFREIARVLKPGGRFAIADIVLDKPLPEVFKKSKSAYASCISGAIDRRAYLRGLEKAGLTEVTVVSEADAAELFGGGCCGPGAELKGVITSIRVTGRKPSADRPSSAE